MIREALLALLLEKPFEKVTITDIVNKADINRGTFYAHFTNPSDVLNSISETIVDDMGVLFDGMDASQILYNPELWLEKISSFIQKDVEFIRKLLAIDKFSDVLEGARKASK